MTYQAINKISPIRLFKIIHEEIYYIAADLSSHIW